MCWTKQNVGLVVLAIRASNSNVKHIVMISKQQLQSVFHRALFVAMMVLSVGIAPIGAQTVAPTPQNLEKAAKQRKFDHFYYEALNAKATFEMANLTDLYMHTYALDSTNASVLMELGALYRAVGNTPKAFDFMNKALSYDPTNYTYNLRYIELCKELERKEDVVKVYEFILKQYPNKTEHLFDVANAYADIGELQKAIDALNKLEGIVGFSESITLNKFRLYDMMGKKQKAFDEIEQVIKKNPTDMRYPVMLGNLYLTEGKEKKAFSYFDKVRATDPNNPQLVLSMVEYYEKKGERQRARQEILNAINNPEIDADMKVNLLLSHMMSLQSNNEKLEGFEPIFDRLFTLHPNHATARLLYGNYLTTNKNSAEAYKQYELYTEAQPDKPEGYENMLRLALQEQDMDKVIEITSTAITYLPKMAQFYYYLGGAYYQKEEYDNALKTFEDGLAHAEFANPFVESDFYGQVGDLNYHKGNHAVAFENYDKALSLNPENLLVLNNYSYYLSLKREKLDKAEQMSSITVKAEPTNPTFLDTYGWILFEQGSYTMAKIYIEKAIEYSTEEEPSAELYEHYGDVLYQLGDKEKAIEQWHKAKAKESDSKTLDKKIETGTYIPAEPDKK